MRDREAEKRIHSAAKFYSHLPVAERITVPAVETLMELFNLSKEQAVSALQEAQEIRERRAERPV